MGDASPYEGDGVRKQRDLSFNRFKRAVLLLLYKKTAKRDMVISVYFLSL